MAVNVPRYSKEEFALRGNAIYDRDVKPILTTANDRHYVAIDIESGAFEIDAYVMSAKSRLLARAPDAYFWLRQVGCPYSSCHHGQWRIWDRETAVDTDEAVKLLADFRWINPYWTGTAFIPFWGSTLDVNLDEYQDRHLTRRQIDTLRTVLEYPHNLRNRIEQALFDYYQKHVYNSSDYFDDDGTDITEQFAPRLDNPGQLLPLIHGPELWIRWCCHWDDAVEFYLAYECTWDQEHGLGISFWDWEIAEFGGFPP